MSKTRKKNNDDLNDGKLLNEIEAIGKALYLDKNASKTSSSVPRNRASSTDKANLLVSDSKLKHGNDDPSAKDKKSFWNWPLKALSHVMNRKFNCCFTLEVLSVEGLPLEFNGLSLCVHWKRRDGELVTSPVKVIRGVAKFEEKLTHTCSVHGSRNGPHHSAKYEAKHFLLYVAVHGNPKLDLGKHRVDLTRLLPLTLEELEDEKSSGTWTTCFKLLGKGRGALINVSFGYQVLGDNLAPSEKNVLQAPERKLSAKTSVKYNLSDNRGSFRRAGSLPTNYKSSTTSRGEDVKVLHGVLPGRVSEFSTSIDVLYQKFNEEKSDSLVNNKIDVSVDDADNVKQPCSSSGSSSANIINENVNAQFSVTEKGKRFLEENVTSEEFNEQVDRTAILLVKSGCVEDISQESSSRTVETGKHECSPKEKDTCTKESLLRDLESVLNHVSNLEKEGLEIPEADIDISGQENELEDKPNGLSQSLNLDDLVDTVADEFLTMLGVEDSSLSFTPSDTEPESPRERLLREFQKEAEASGCSLFGFDIDEADVEDYDDYAPIISGWEEFCEGSEFLPEYSDINPVDRLQDAKIRGKMMEDLETQALMEDWGLNEKAFQNSPPQSSRPSGGFGSPIDLLPEKILELPALGENLGPIIQTKTGGFLRSMNPVLFRNAKSGGKLVMQVSSPVVVPAELGSGVTEILQHLSTVGLEKLSMQTKKLMPLEDITGKTMQEIAWERQNLVQEKVEGHGIPSNGKKRGKRAKKSKKSSSSSGVDNVDSEYVSFEDLAPLAMDKIEALSIKGLRVQSGMPDEAHSNTSSSGSEGMDGAVGLQLMDVKDNETDEVDGLMGLSLTLDEWMKLDSGEIDEDQISERTSKLLAAHHANCTDLDFLRNKVEKKQGKKASRSSSGLLGNNFTVALMVQLRDPFRDFEPVGTPMLALIQVERVFVPPKPKIYSTVSDTRDANDGDDDLESVPKDETKEGKPQEEELNAEYKISEVHVAGLKSEPGKKKVWGNTTQEQSGSRWLVANGMAKNKNPFVKSKSSLPATVTSQRGSTLWGISALFRK